MAYTVGANDSWFSIAGKIYGDQRMAGQLQAANPGIAMLRPGMTLNTPSQAQTGPTGQVTLSQAQYANLETYQANVDAAKGITGGLTLEETAAAGTVTQPTTGGYISASGQLMPGPPKGVSNISTLTPETVSEQTVIPVKQHAIMPNGEVFSLKKAWEIIKNIPPAGQRKKSDEFANWPVPPGGEQITARGGPGGEQITVRGGPGGEQVSPSQIQREIAQNRTTFGKTPENFLRTQQSGMAPEEFGSKKFIRTGGQAISDIWLEPPVASELAAAQKLNSQVDSFIQSGDDSSLPPKVPFQDMFAYAKSLGAFTFIGINSLDEIATTLGYTYDYSQIAYIRKNKNEIGLLGDYGYLYYGDYGSGGGNSGGGGNGRTSGSPIAADLIWRMATG